MSDGSSDAQAASPLLEQQRPSLSKERWRLPESWDMEQVSEAEDLIQTIERGFRDYTLEEGILVTENSSRGYSHERSVDRTPRGVPWIEVHPGRKNESLAHELGHDILRTSQVDLEEARMIRSTFAEAFADLVALTYTDIEPYSRDLDRDPGKDLEAYGKLSKMLEPERREEEISKLGGIGLSIHNENYSMATKKALDMVKVPPTCGETVTVGELKGEAAEIEYFNKLTEDSKYQTDNFFVENVEFNGAEYSEILENELDIWRITQVLEHDGELREPILKAYRDDSRIADHVSATSEKIYGESGLKTVMKDPERVLKQTVHDRISRTYDLLQDFKEGLETQDEPFRVLDGISHRSYASKWEESVDYPHNIGGEYAEVLYQNNVLPHDLLRDPQPHLSAVETKIRREISSHI